MERSSTKRGIIDSTEEEGDNTKKIKYNPLNMTFHVTEITNVEIIRKMLISC